VNISIIPNRGLMHNLNSSYYFTLAYFFLFWHSIPKLYSCGKPFCHNQGGKGAFVFVNRPPLDQPTGGKPWTLPCKKSAKIFFFFTFLQQVEIWPLIGYWIMLLLTNFWCGIWIYKIHCLSFAVKQWEMGKMDSQ